VCVTAEAALRDLIERGSNALAGGGWVEARACFEQALGCSDSAEAWDGLSWACWWLEDGTAAIQAREHAYRLYKDAGERRAAARMAIWLANDHLDFRGERAVAQGWLRRATRILDDLDAAPEHGWLAALEAQLALEAGELAEAARIGTRARQLGRDLGITDLEMLGLATEGLALVTEGELKEGMWRLDEAAAAALGGEFDGFVGVGWTCCYLIYACERVRDYDRAAQWCRKVEEFAGRMRIQFLNGVCRVHYAAVLAWHGSWKEADKTQRAAALELAVRAMSAAGDVHGAQVHLAELRSLAQAVPTGPLRAAVSFCDGVVAAAAGDQESAAVAFEDAAALFAASDAPYELGRARTELARALSELGRRDRARREAADALVILERTGASALRKRAQQVLDSFTHLGGLAGPLTRRERQVLGLIARGMRDGDIASALSLSQHTVHRHVSNIYANGCSTRAAAVAKVAELEML
jgi:LuxR family transcriptional regulator, maltose regulon positive regulatory protein